MVTDGVSGTRTVPESLVAAAEAGIELIQLRNRTIASGALVVLARLATGALTGFATRLVVNDRLDVAIAAGAAGVHLRGDSMPAARVRAGAPAGFIVGRSVHSEDEAIEADESSACDYLLFGTVFPSSSKPADHRPAGLDALRRVCRRVSTPVLAIGGITVATARQVRDAGATGVAAIGLFRDAGDLAHTVRALREALER